MNYVCPFEWRYGSEEIRSLLSRDSIIKRMIEVEAALLKSLEELNIAPKGCSSKILELKDKISADEVYKREKITGHEVFSLVEILCEKLGEKGSYIHFGATSNDIIDTAWALILRDVLNILSDKLKSIIKKLVELSRKYKDVVMVGRTHGQHALPITLGFKFANYAYELTRSYERIIDCKNRVIKGKIAGAVGTMAGWKDLGLAVEKLTLNMLGLEPHLISTQIAPRDGYAELVSVLGILTSQLDRLAVEVRELSRPEIGEVYEARWVKIGSSTMPHKKNPIISERISGIARYIRGYVVSFIENIVLWHERDLSNSSFERAALSHILIATDEALESTLKLLSTLNVDVNRISYNLELSKGVNLSEAIMLELIRRGMSRIKAYKIVRSACKEASIKGEPLINILAKHKEVTSLIDPDSMKDLLNSKSYLGQYDAIIERTLKYVGKVLDLDS